MAKRSKAKAKDRKPTKKTKKTKKAAKKAKRKAPRRTRSDVDPCQAQEDAVSRAQEAVDRIKRELEEPDLSPEQRRSLEQALRRAEGRLNAAETALGRCRMQHPGSHPH